MPHTTTVQSPRQIYYYDPSRLNIRLLTPSCLSNSTLANGGSRKTIFFRSYSASTVQYKNVEDNHESINNGPIVSRIQEQIRQGQLQADGEQLELARQLDILRDAVCRTDSAVVSASRLTAQHLSDAPPKHMHHRILGAVMKHLVPRLWNHARSRSSLRGIYIHGPVGVGKSYLMDLFYNSLVGSSSNSDDKNFTQPHNQLARRKIRRAHFNEFMLDVHDRIHQFKKQHPKQDALPAVAVSLAKEARILCLDEFQITDIADAMILKRLFGMLWMDHHLLSSKGIGMVVVATSNRAPEQLYEGGLNRGRFLPFIETMKRHMDVVKMTGEKDYRRETSSSDEAVDELLKQQSFFWPLNEQTRESLEQIFALTGSDMEYDTKIPVRMGRHVTVPRSTGKNHCAWFDFDDLCANPLGAADYLAICDTFSTLIVDNVPQLDGSRFNEARRFVTLIDAVYESRTRLVIASAVPLEDLLVDFDATVETNDGDEEIAVEGIKPSDRERAEKDLSGSQTTFVKGEGGSSSSAATTMVRTQEGDVEWSATGRIGVSLAQLSAVRDVSFSFQRAESRLVEINNGKWCKS